jgi:FMN-dependent NADH-azoreductase
MDLFDAGLPEFTGELASAKQKFLMGQELTVAEQQQWQAVTQLVEQFVGADHYLFGVPMWNFNVPYKLKQYIDLITHPGLTFTRDEQGIRGLASGATTVIYSRGGDYSPKDGAPDPYDFQSPYLRAWLGLVGLGPVTEVLVQSTMAGPDALAAAVHSAAGQLVAAAQQLGDG